MSKDSQPKPDPSKIKVICFFRLLRFKCLLSGYFDKPIHGGIYVGFEVSRVPEPVVYCPIIPAVQFFVIITCLKSQLSRIVSVLNTKL